MGPRHPPPTDTAGFVLGVLGAPGGAGASTLATACAVRACLAGCEVVLVDARPWSGGVEVLAGLDTTPGLRWADLVGVRGDVDPQRLLTVLPVSEDGLRCLSWDATVPEGQVPGPDPVVTALRRATQVLVIDLPGPDAAAGYEAWWAACDAVILVSQASVTGIGAAMVLARACAPRGAVLRTPSHLGVDELASVLGAPVLATLGEDRSIARCLERGVAVGREAGAVAEAADLVLSVLLPPARAA